MHRVKSKVVGTLNDGHQGALLRSERPFIDLTGPVWDNNGKGKAVMVTHQASDLGGTATMYATEYVLLMLTLVAGNDVNFHLSRSQVNVVPKSGVWIDMPDGIRFMR